MISNIFSRLLNKWVLIGVAVFCVLVVGGLTAWNNYVDNRDNTDLAILEKSSPKSITDKVQKALEAKFDGDDLSFNTSATAPYWPVEDSTFYVNYTDNDASELNVVFDDSNLLSGQEIIDQRNAIITSITSTLVSQGFEKSTDSAYKQFAEAYTDDDLICVVDSTSSGVLSSPVSLNCGSEFQYNIGLDTYQDAKAFSDAYAAAGNTIKPGDTYVVDSDEASATDGYRKASVGINNVDGDGGASLLFYKTPGSDTWQFFIGKQSILPCSSYNSADLKAAFKDDACYDTATNAESKVE